MAHTSTEEESTMLRRSLQVLVILAAPATALAFDAIDSLRFPSSGVFPAYPPDPVSPRNFWVQAGILRDNNVVRRDEGLRESETIARLGAGVSADQRVWGRQSVHLEARADAYKFNNLSELDHVAYGALGELRWELGNQLAGTAGYGRRHYLVDLGERLTVARDTVTENHFFGSAAYALTPRWRLRGTLDHLDTDRPELASSGTKVTSAAGGLEYATPLGNAIGAEVRASTGDAPVDETIDPSGLAINNDYDEREIAAILTYRPSPMLRVAARLGQTERSYTVLPNRDFEGTTGRLDTEWRPGNKTMLGFSAYRVPRSIIAIGASHVIVEGVSFGPSWAPTQKLVFGVRLVSEDREYEGDPAAALGLVPVRQETVRAWRFSAGWEVTRHHQIVAAFETGERRSNRLGFDYDYDTVMANLRYIF
jgi:hypothetical protein